MKVRVKKLYPQLKGFFEKDEIIEMKAILYKEDKVIVKAFNNIEPIKMGLPSWDTTVAPKGSAKSFYYEKQNGTKYSTQTITNIIGYKKPNDWLEKI